MLCKRPSCQYNFNRPPSLSVFRVCTVRTIHGFLPLVIHPNLHAQTIQFIAFARAVFIILDAVIQNGDLILSNQIGPNCAIVIPRTLCSAVFNLKTSWKYVSIFEQSTEYNTGIYKNLFSFGIIKKQQQQQQIKKQKKRGNNACCLLCHGSSRQRDFNCPLSVLCFGVCTACTVHVFLTASLA